MKGITDEVKCHKKKGHCLETLIPTSQSLMLYYVYNSNVSKDTPTPNVIICVYFLQIHQLPPDDLKIRKIENIDIANDPIKSSVSIS